MVQSKAVSRVNPATTIQYQDVGTPGAYVSKSGLLFRIPEEALKQGHSPVLNFVSSNPDDTTLVLIEGNPNVAIGKARQLAANADIEPRF
ncbi:MAG: hypothetical protein HYY50_05770 [Candidatus Kerfeldbacteria bacterium]|nr:hypothetical protein [Candidatus Kerfeldbacteria bacterium]